ncbi:transcriptional repressor [Nowakowskiella sp. JEL0407]|nr:transcriptional repressor [Nowakowskiella sp. JEL0407]
MENITSAEKKSFKCTETGCGRSFTSSGHLVRHQRIHTGSRPYSCLIPGCPAKFSRHDNSMQHYRSHLHRLIQTNDYEIILVPKKSKNGISKKANIPDFINQKTLELITDLPSTTQADSVGGSEKNKKGTRKKSIDSDKSNTTLLVPDARNEITNHSPPQDSFIANSPSEISPSAEFSSDFAIDPAFNGDFSFPQQHGNGHQGEPSMSRLPPPPMPMNRYGEHYSGDAGGQSFPRYPPVNCYYFPPSNPLPPQYPEYQGPQKCYNYSPQPFEPRYLAPERQVYPSYGYPPQHQPHHSIPYQNTDNYYNSRQMPSSYPSYYNPTGTFESSSCNAQRTNHPEIRTTQQWSH